MLSNAFQRRKYPLSLGQALLHVLEENMQWKSGARADVSSFVVLLTDGKSQDDAIAAANQLKSAGMEIIVVGESRRDFLHSSENIIV